MCLSYFTLYPSDSAVHSVGGRQSWYIQRLRAAPPDDRNRREFPGCVSSGGGLSHGGDKVTHLNIL